MATFKPRHFATHTGLHLYLEQELIRPAELWEEGPKKGEEKTPAIYEFVVSLEGDQIKEQYRGPSEKDAAEVFDSIEAHYAWRKEHDPLNQDGTQPEYRQFPVRAV